MRIFDLIELLKKLDASEAPEAVDALLALKNIPLPPRTLADYRKAMDLLLEAASQAVDVTRTEVDDELVAKLVAVREKLIPLVDEIVKQFGGEIP